MSAARSRGITTWAVKSFSYRHDPTNLPVDCRYFSKAVFCGSRSLGSIARKLFLILALSVPLAANAFSEPTSIPLLDAPRALPKISFSDQSGNTVTLDKWAGKVVLLNIWATWCTPCRIEMPTLDNLQQKLGGDRFDVVALSIDEAGLSVVERFYEEIGIENLEIFIDPSYTAARELKAIGLPTTILIDTQGRELGRLVGPAEWDTPEFIAFFEEVVATQNQ